MDCCKANKYSKCITFSVGMSTLDLPKEKGPPTCLKKETHFPLSTCTQVYISHKHLYKACLEPYFHCGPLKNKKKSSKCWKY